MKRYIVLGAILLFGLLIRCYNLDFPSIGYHNMKENEYLSMSEEMKNKGDYVNRRVYFYNAFEPDPVMRIYPQPPIVSYQNLLAWNIFGENLWGARLFNVLFGVLSIIVIYWAAQLLFDNIFASLSCAFLLAIMPLAVFFSRNLQPESPAFFFMILGNLFYLRFTANFKKYNLLLGGIAFSVAWVYKFSFIFGALPFLVCFPYKRIFKGRKESFSHVLSFLFPYLIIIGVIFWLVKVGQWQFLPKKLTLSRINLFEVFTPGYWKQYGKMIWWYVQGENFTIVYTIAAVCGIVAAFFRRNSLVGAFIIGWVFTLVIYCVVFPDFINQHNYYQMPFLLLVCVASVYAVLLIAEFIKKSTGVDFFILAMITVVVTSGGLIYGSVSRMFGTVFLGTDAAGESLREFTASNDRVFLLTYAQGNAIARYAQRYMGWPENLKELKRDEIDFNVKYMCFYPAEYAKDLEKTNPDIYKYMMDNYHVKEAGVMEDPSRVVYLIMEKGKGSDPNNFLQSFSGKTQIRSIYRLFGKYLFFYIVRPEETQPKPQSVKS